MNQKHPHSLEQTAARLEESFSSQSIDSIFLIFLSIYPASPLAMFCLEQLCVPEK